MQMPAINREDPTAGNATKRLKRRVIMMFIWGAALFCVLPGLSVKADAAFAERVTKTVVKTEPVPFSTTYIDLPAVYTGYSEVVREGVMGQREIAAQVVMEGDRVVKVVSIKSADKGVPIDRVIRRGTKVLKSETADGSAWKTSFISPLKTGYISADFHNYPNHNGIDIAAAYGTPVYAAAGGVVRLSSWYGEYGKCVVIDHPDGSRTLYGHNSTLTVAAGQRVKQGEQIANVGSTGNSTGNHLHFEIRAGGKILDPLKFIELSQ